jgi:hypothetical protein
MANEIAKATQNFFEKYGEAATQRNIVGDLLLFTKFGEWVHGRDRAKLAMGTTLAAYMNTLAVGWVCWLDGQIVESRMGLVCEGFVPPKRDELGLLDQQKWERFDDNRPKDPWRLSNNLVLIALETEALFTFSTSSRGGLGAIGELSKQYGKHMRVQPHEQPILELGVSSYQHPDRSIGEVREPVLKVVGWISNDKLPPIDGAPAANDEGSAPPLALPEPEPPLKTAAPNTKRATARAPF